MSNVVQFPTGVPIDNDPNREPDYFIAVYETPGGGFDWSVDSDEPIPPDRLASDLAAIALSLRPPPRTFLERLHALIFGDDQ